MKKITFGSTGLILEKNGFGCLPIQRVSEEEAVRLLHMAYDGGINFFDTARAYSDSEKKVGAAFSGMRDRIVLATKTGAQTAEGFWRDLETSLRTLKTDYIDIYQFHNPAFCPKPGGEDGLYDAALEAKKQGKIRHISITNHRLAVAQEAIDSGSYASLQFPFSYLAGEQELALAEGCRAHGMGFIAMKGMAGGLLRLLLQGPQGGHIRRRVPRGQFLHGGALQIIPQLQDAGSGLGIRDAAVEVHDGAQGLQAAGLCVVRHGDTPTGGDVQKAQPVQLTQTFVDHGLAYLHLVSQFPLGGQAVAGAQFAGQDHALQLLDEQLLDGGGDDLTKGHGKGSFTVCFGPTRTI